MTVASGSNRRVDYVEETTYNTPPSSATWKNFRNTGGQFKKDQTNSESQEIRPDRQTSGVIFGAQSSSGELQFELSATSFDDMLEAALMGTWTSDKLVIGLTDRSFAFVEQFQDIGQTLLSTGQVANTLNLSTTADTVTGSFGFLGKGHTNDLTAIGTPIYSAPDTTIAFTSYEAVAKLDDANSCIVTQLDITLTNNREVRNAIGDCDLEPKVGKVSATGNATIYFENMAVYQKWLGNESIDLEILFSDGANTQTWILPKAFATDGTKDVSGDADIFISLPITATYDQGEGSSLVIERGTV